MHGELRWRTVGKLPLIDQSEVGVICLSFAQRSMFVLLVLVKKKSVVPYIRFDATLSVIN